MKPACLFDRPFSCGKIRLSEEQSCFGRNLSYFFSFLDMLKKDVSNSLQHHVAIVLDRGFLSNFSPSLLNSSEQISSLLGFLSCVDCYFLLLLAFVLLQIHNCSNFFKWNVTWSQLQISCMGSFSKSILAAGV